MAMLRAALFLLSMSVAAQAQEVPVPPTGLSTALIIDSDRLFLDTQYGLRIIAELDEEAAVLQAENDRIVAELIAEESALTKARPGMTAEAFREAATAFDTKAQEVRRSRDGARDALIEERTRRRTAFFERVHPIVGQLMVERGASVVLDRRTVFLAVGSADITRDAIALIDATLGDGAQDDAIPQAPGDIVTNPDAISPDIADPAPDDPTAQ